MAGNLIETQMRLTGEKEYVESIKNAQRELKVLKSELKAETSAFDENTSAEQRNATASANLKKQLEAQQKIVQTNEKRLAELEKQYGKDSKQVQEFKVRLNDSKTAMNKTQQELNRLAQQEKEATGETRTLTEEVGKLGREGAAAGTQLSENLIKNLEFNQAVEKFQHFAGAVKDILGGIASLASSVIGAVQGIVIETAQAADDMVTLSQTSGLSLDTLNKLAYANRAGYDISYATFAQAAAKLRTTQDTAAFADAETKTTGKGKNAVTTYKPAGLFHGLNYITQADGTTRSATTEETLWNVLRFASQYYRQYGETQELSEALNMALGKSFADFMPFIQDPGLIDAYVRQGEENGLVRTAEETNQIAAIQDNLDRITAIMTSIRELFVLLFAQNFGDITTSYGDMMQALNDYENALMGKEGYDEAEALERLKSSTEKLMLDVLELLKSAFDYFIDTLNSLAAQTDENGDPTALARVAQSILDTGEWIRTQQEDLSKLFADLSDVLRKISDFFGMGRDQDGNVNLYTIPFGKDTHFGSKAWAQETANGIGDFFSFKWLRPDEKAETTARRSDAAIEALANDLYDVMYARGVYADSDPDTLGVLAQSRETELFQALGGDIDALRALTERFDELNAGGAEDLPAEWFTSAWGNVSTGLTESSASQTAAANRMEAAAQNIEAAVAGIPGAIGSIRLYIDGAAVGRAVSGSVNTSLRVNVRV